MSRMSRLVCLLQVLFLLLAFAGIGLVAPAVGQDEAASSAEPVLVDEFGMVGECEFRGRIDTFLAELSQKSGVQGYIINYKSAAELPGDRDAFGRERYIANHIGFRNFDSSRITIVRGGYRSEIATELWVVPAGVEPPEPTRTVPEPTTPEGETLLYASRDLDLYEYEATPNEFVLVSYLQREAELYAKLNSENEAAETESGETGGEDNTANIEVEEEEPEVTDERSEEQKEDDRFDWVERGLAKHAATREGGRGVIIFYADDQQYDIGKLMEFIEKGANRLAAKSTLERSRINVRFGGYRETPDVDFWFVPANGKEPIATPGERPVENPDGTEN